jgi:hypothetical protein
MSQYVIAKYTVSERFEVPEGVDLNDKNQVKQWFVKWNVLHIIFADESAIAVNGDGWIDGVDQYKTADSETVHEEE